MLSLKVQFEIAQINEAFQVNVEAVHEAVDNGKYSEFTLGNTQVVYGFSNRKAQVCYVFDNYGSEQDRIDILTPTKGYAVARIAEVANAYIASKAEVVVEETISEVDALRAQVAQLEADNQALKVVIRDNAVSHEKEVMVLNRQLSALSEMIDKIRSISLAGVFTSIKQSV